jgi:hypothetical protein
MEEKTPQIYVKIVEEATKKHIFLLNNVYVDVSMKRILQKESLHIVTMMI